MPLKVKTQTIHVVDYAELERLANEVYGREPKGGSPRQFHAEYNFAEVQECSNDTDHSFTVTGDLTRDADTVSLIRSGIEVPIYHNDTLLQCLCDDGHIEPGNYLVQVSW